MLCADLNGKEIQKRAICTHTVDLLSYIAENNTTFQSNYTLIKTKYIFKKTLLPSYLNVKD